MCEASRALGLSLAGPGATLPMLCARGACAEPLRDARRPREPPLLEACLGARASCCSSSCTGSLSCESFSSSFPIALSHIGPRRLSEDCQRSDATGPQQQHGIHRLCQIGSHLDWCNSITLSNAGSCGCAGWLAPRGAPCLADAQILLSASRCVSSAGLRQHPRLHTCMFAARSDSSAGQEHYPVIS